MEKEDIRPFANYRPHSEDPLTMETFEKLDSVVKKIYEDLGIEDENSRPLSPATNRIVEEITISRTLTPSGVVLLYIGKLSIGRLTSIDLRNDATTPGTPGVPMAIQRQIKTDGHVYLPSEANARFDEPVSDTAVGLFVEQIEGRAERGLFRPERRLYVAYEAQSNE